MVKESDGDDGNVCDLDLESMGVVANEKDSFLKERALESWEALDTDDDDEEVKFDL